MINDHQLSVKEHIINQVFFSCYSMAKRLHAKRFSHILFSVVIMVTIPKSVTPMCQISLMQFTASTLSGWARRLLEVHYPLRWMSWPNLFQILLFYASSAKLLDRPLRHKEWEGRTEPKTDWWVGSISPADHQTDFLHAPVLFMWRELWPLFSPRQHSAFSRDPLSLPQPARHHRVEINKTSPGRVKATSLKLKKGFFFFFF